jgi:flavin-binding protein dodecin
MSDNVYSISEIVGSSKESVDDAIRGAVARASKTLRNLDWFTVSEIRGHIDQQQVCHYQVTMKVGFRLEDPSLDGGSDQPGEVDSALLARYID